MSQDAMDPLSSQLDDALRDAAENGNLGLVIQILESGGNLHAKGANNDSLLHIAAAEGHTHVCEELLRRGIPVDILSDDGWTSAMNAAYWGHEATFDFLANQGANLSVQDKKGKTAYGVSFNNMAPTMPLSIAKRGLTLMPGDLQILQAKPYDGLTAIEVAARGGLAADLLQMLQATETWPMRKGLEGLREMAELSGSRECVAIVDSHRALDVIRNLSARHALHP